MAGGRPLGENGLATELLCCFVANPKDKAGFVVLLDKLQDYREGLPQEIFDFLGGTVCRPHPNELGRLPLENTAFLKVRVFRDNGVPIVLSVLPNGRILCASQSAGMDMGRPWIQIS
jgi:hypothetical protein